MGTGNGNVTFQVQLPAELGSRAYFGNGTQAKNLYVAVYDANGNVLDKLTNFNGETPAAGMTVNNFTTSLSTTVTIPLVKGQTYTVVFWADSYAPVEEGAESTSPFTFTPADASMKVDYTKFVGNSDAPDAFFAAVTVPADGTTHKVELKRPFAQINIGTDDLDAASKAGLTVTKGGMNLTGASNTLNLREGTISSSADFDGNVSFATQSINTGMDFPVTKTDAEADATPYSYLAMGYILCGDAQSAKASLPTVELMLNDRTEPFATYGNIPAQGNFRTNIYGSLLTNKEKFTVTINPAFVNSFNNGVLTVDNEEDLVAAVKQGTNVKLDKDLEMDGSFIQEIPENKSVEVDLAGNDLSLTSGATLQNKAISLVNKSNEPSAVKIKKNGTIFSMVEGGKLHIKNVNLTVTEGVSAINSCAVLVDGDNADAVIEDCVITYKAYAISTNASKHRENMTITLNNVKAIPEPTSNRTGSPFLFNTPMTVNATDCLFQGINNGGILRGGTYNMNNCTFEQTLVPENSPLGAATTKDAIKKIFHNFNRNNWGTGDNVPLAALTVGNKGDEYQYPTIVTLTNCTLIVPEVARNTNNEILSSLPAMYVYANQGEGLGVTITMTGCKYNEILEFASGNIVYNGRAISAAENIPANVQ